MGGKHTDVGLCSEGVSRLSTSISMTYPKLHITRDLIEAICRHRRELFCLFGYNPIRRNIDV